MPEQKKVNIEFTEEEALQVRERLTRTIHVDEAYLKSSPGDSLSRRETVINNLGNAEKALDKVWKALK